VYVWFLLIWALAVPVIWARSSTLTKGYRIALIVCMTVAIFSLAEALTFYIIAGKLDSLDTAQALRDAHYNRVGSCAAFATSSVSFAAFLFLIIRGELTARRTQTI